MALFRSATIHLHRNFGSNVNWPKFFAHMILGLCVTFVGGHTNIAQSHFRILFQSCCSPLQKGTYKIIAGRNICTYKLFTKSQMLCPTQSKLPSSRTTLQVNNSLIMAILRCYTIQSFDFTIHTFILPEHISFLHPSRILKDFIQLR